MRRTVRRPRLTVPTNLQAVIVVDMLLCLSGAVAPMLSEELSVCRKQQMGLLACVMRFTAAHPSTAQHSTAQHGTAMKLWQRQ